MVIVNNKIIITWGLNVHPGELMTRFVTANSFWPLPTWHLNYSLALYPCG